MWTRRGQLAWLLAIMVIMAVARPQGQEEDDGEEDEEEDEGDGGPDVEYDYDLVGADGESEFSLGMVEPDEQDRVDEESVAFFNLVGTSGSLPKSYSSLKEGLLTPVRNQGKCGSCAAYASATAVETCFKKLTGKFLNISEQQFLDCAFDWEGAGACQGSSLHAYLNWGSEKQQQLASLKQYPYKGVGSPFSCPDPLPIANAGAKLSSSFYTYEGTEDQLKSLVYDHGAVVIGVWFSKASLKKFTAYKKGVFDGCGAGGKDAGGHAMVAVGYGREKGKDYWLIRNSWGTKWGEKGYVKLRRGVGACSIGKAVAVVECEVAKAKKKKKKKKTNKNKVKGEYDEDEYDEEDEYEEDEGDEDAEDE